ncbi:MAG: hypothetical protein LIP77_12225 [Planctomycetes bacterium]|nr:hypothetical protein [Planctomycetota bacterium]
MADYSSLWNFGNDSSSTAAGLTADLMNQWAMRHANAAAYRNLLKAQETGEIKQGSYYKDILSDKLFNDYYDTTTGKVTQATYAPDPATTASIDSELTAGEHLDNMRRLALAAIGNPGSLTSIHYDMFELMRQAIASNLVTGSPNEMEIVLEEARGASVGADYHAEILETDQTFTIAGPDGEVDYVFAAGTSLEDIIAAINADAATTGVTAEYAFNDDTFSIVLTTSDTGAETFIRVDQTAGDLFAAAGTSVSARGADEVRGTAEIEASGVDTIAAMAVGVYTGVLFEDQTFTITGASGSQQFSFAKGTTVEEMVQAINDASETLGITAEVIYNSAGEAEGFGLAAEKAGTGQFVQVTQEKGSLFAAEGKSVKVTGSSIDGSGDGPGITSLSDLGRVTINGVTYSFADLARGGSASLEVNPNAALAVIDQALQDIYSGRAEIAGFDPSSTYLSYVSGSYVAAASTNALEIGNYGSDALTDWINQYVRNGETLP